MIEVGRRKNDFLVLYFKTEPACERASERTNERRNLYELVTMSKANVIYQQEQQLKTQPKANFFFAQQSRQHSGQKLRSSRIYSANATNKIY